MQKSGYREAFGISQSIIKKFREISLPKFKEVYIDRLSDNEETTSSLVFGSLTDTLAFEPKLYEERFFLPERNVSMPGEKVKQIIEMVYRKAKELVENKNLLNKLGSLPEPLHVPNLKDLGEFRDLTIACAKEIKYGKDNWKNSTILDNVHEDGWDYYVALVGAGGRNIITSLDSLDANKMVSILKSHHRTLPYFTQQEGEILLFQQEIYNDYTTSNKQTIPLKCAVDIIRIIPLLKEVHIPDLKTIYDVEEFSGHVRKYNYLLQSSFYRYMVREWLKTYNKGAYKDFTITTPFDIVIDRQTMVPYKYRFDEVDLDIVEWGNTSYGQVGWRSTLEDISWHIHNKVWNEPRELYETGEIKLKFFND